MRSTKPIRIARLALALALSLLSLAFFGCRQALSSAPAAAEPPRIEVYLGQTLNATYTLDSAGKVLTSRSLGSYGDWSQRSYEYGSDGQVRSVSESFDDNSIKRSRSFSSSRSLSRSGKVQEVRTTVTETTNILGRATAASDRVVSYVYDDADNLVSIVKEDEYGNQEVKNVGRPTYSATELESGEISPVRGAYSRPKASARTEVASAAGRSPATASGGLEGCYVEIGSDVMDFRPLGIRETFSRGVDVSTSIDQLKEGQVFIDEAGKARKLLSIEKKGSTLVYRTRKPKIHEVLTDLYMPPTSYDWDSMVLKPELLSDSVKVLAPGSEPTSVTRGLISQPGNWTLDPLPEGTELSYSKAVGNDNLSASFALEVQPSVELVLDYAYNTGTKHNPQLSWATISANLGIDAHFQLLLKGEWEDKKAIWVKGPPESDFATIQFGLFWIPSIEGSLTSNLYFKYDFGYTNEVKAMVGFLLPQEVMFGGPGSVTSTMSYGYDLNADLTAQLKILALGGEVTIFDLNIVEAYPGAGVYGKLAGELHMSDQWENGESVKREAWIQGSGEIGAFVEASISFWDESYKHTFIDKQFPFASFEAKKELLPAPKADPANPGVPLPDLIAPGAVRNAIANAISQTIFVSWLEPADADFSRVEISCSDSGVATKTVNKDATIGASRQATYQNLTAGKTYSFTIVAVDLAGNKSAGTTVSAKPYVQATHPSQSPNGVNLYTDANGNVFYIASAYGQNVVISKWTPVMFKPTSTPGKGDWRSALTYRKGYWWNEETDLVWKAGGAFGTMEQMERLQMTLGLPIMDTSGTRWVAPVAPLLPTPQKAVYTQVNLPEFFNAENYLGLSDNSWQVIAVKTSNTKAVKYFWYAKSTGKYYDNEARAMKSVDSIASPQSWSTIAKNSAVWSDCLKKNPSFPQTLTWSK